MSESGQTLQTLRYQRGSLSQNQLRQEIADFAREAQHSAELQKEVQDAGVPLDQVEALTSSLEISQEQGITDQDIMVIIQGVNLAITLVKNVILPWIRRRKGDQTVGPPQGE